MTSLSSWLSKSPLLWRYPNSGSYVFCLSMHSLFPFLLKLCQQQVLPTSLVIVLEIFLFAFWAFQLSLKQIWCGTNTVLRMLRRALEWGHWPKCVKVAQDWRLLSLLRRLSNSEKSRSKLFVTESSFKRGDVTKSLFLIIMVALPLLGNWFL